MSATARRKKVGFISFQRSDKKVMKKWKSYRFEVNASYFLYFKTENLQKPDGMIVLATITKLETNMTKDSSYPLQVHFRGKAMQGSSSPWVLDLTSNEERIQWMEAILPGSSKDLQRFSNSGSLHLASPLSSMPVFQDDPHSIGSSELSDSLTSNGSLHSVQNRSQPQDYIDPSPSGRGWENQVGSRSNSSDRYASNPSRMNHSTDTRPGASSTGSQDHLLSPTTYPASSIAKPSSSLKAQPAARKARTSEAPTSNTRHETHRQTIAHGPREHPAPQLLSQLSRSKTERVSCKSPMHLYEMDQGMENLQKSIKPSPPERSPPHTKPRNKRPPPQQGGGSKFPSSASSKHSLDAASPIEDTDSRYTMVQDLDLSASFEKEGEYEIPDVTKEGQYDVPQPVSREKTAQVKGGAGNNFPQPKPRQSQSPSSSLRPVAKPRRKKQPVTEHEYLDLMPGSALSSGQDDRSDLSMFGLKPDLVQNLSADQLRSLKDMLQQAAGQQCPSPSSSLSPGGTSVTTTQQNGSRRDSYNHSSAQAAMDYVESLETDRILVTDDDDSEGYLRRPAWAKAVGLHASRMKPELMECDDLSDLQEEALYIPRSMLTDFHEIGEGQFGKVFRAVMHHGHTHMTVAVKTAKKSSLEKERAEFHREMNIMSQMRHPNIVQLHGIIRDDVPAPWIVLEYLCNGDIKHFLIKHQKPVEKLVKYMIDISMGMHYLSEKGLVHRDLAARNILVSEDETCKVSDFGMLRELPKDDSIYHMHTNVPCPVRWMPPESISDRLFSPASDVWSFGVLQWEMFQPSKTPYHKLANLEVALKVSKGHRLEIPPECPAVVSRIMKACWSHVPEKRPSFLLIATLLSTKAFHSS